MTAAAGVTAAQDSLSGDRGQYIYDTTNSALYINVNADNLITTSDFKIGLNAASTASATVVDGDINFVITGGTGADVITAGGADTITGGGGGADVIDVGSDSAADVVVLGGNTAADSITNFDPSSEDIFHIDVNGSGETGAFTTTNDQARTLLVTGPNAAVSTNAAAGATISFQTVAAAGNFNATAGNEVIVFTATTINCACSAWRRR